jgi:excisionase family DNA binding protein
VTVYHRTTFCIYSVALLDTSALSLRSPASADLQVNVPPGPKISHMDKPTQTAPQTALVTIKEAALLLAVSTRTVSRLISSNKLDAVRLMTRVVRVRRADLEALAAGEVSKELSMPENHFNIVATKTL